MLQMVERALTLIMAVIAKAMSLCSFPRTLDCGRHPVSQAKAIATKTKSRPISAPNGIHMAKAGSKTMVHAANFGMKIEVLKITDQSQNSVLVLV